ncbi:hypothetical protein L210DRAFT_3650420 [Boletus edulis BED1]|uniref:BAH domain-containing protein n=1 Tax=Boletus edulis BED1 TaxID=1328754 RepID=A0AAD4BJH1_BOLED|nr:hypothetical protein L210DRAFT_3650420 [Boletus edulis BED1]
MSHSAVDAPTDRPNTLVIATRLTPEQVVDNRVKRPPHGIEGYHRYDCVSVFFGQTNSQPDGIGAGVMWELIVGDVIRVYHAGTVKRGREAGMSDMDYWYGSIERVCVVDDGKESGKPNIWIYVRWYYRAEDVKCYDTGIAERMKRRELLVSDEHDYIHFASIDGMVKIARVDERKATYDETDDHDDPSSGFFTRWGLEVKIVEELGKGPRVVGVSLKDASECACDGCPDRAYNDEYEQRYCGQCDSWMHRRCLAREAKKVKSELIHDLFKETTDDEELIRCVTRPIARGGIHKTFGNGNEVAKVREAWKGLESGEDVSGWDEDVNTYALWPEDEGARYYMCPNCKEHWV